ncbi:hypothetical protein D3C83_220240 [compost metagenome]
MSRFDLPAAGLPLGEEHVVRGIELVDALHGTDVDAGAVLHVDAGFGDDRETSHVILLIGPSRFVHA